MRTVAEQLSALGDQPAVPALALRATERIARMMREFDAAAVESVFSDGLLNVMEAPEFSHSEKLRSVFGVLQNLDYLGRLVSRVAAADDVQVLIGAGLTVLILMHSGREAGLGGMGFTPASQGGTHIVERNLTRLTVAVAVLFFLNTVLLYRLLA